MFYSPRNRGNLDRFYRFRSRSISAAQAPSTVDLTIVRLEDGAELDMGTLFDYFGPESAGDYPHLTELQRANRLLLADVMQAHGFVPYEAEWWHFTLRNEPYPETYFSFPVR